MHKIMMKLHYISLKRKRARETKCLFRKLLIFDHVWDTFSHQTSRDCQMFTMYRNTCDFIFFRHSCQSMRRGSVLVHCYHLPLPTSPRPYFSFKFCLTDKIKIYKYFKFIYLHTSIYNFVESKSDAVFVECSALFYCLRRTLS